MAFVYAALIAYVVNQYQSHAGAARIGGDEFVIMYHLDFVEADIHGLARRILHDITEPFALGNRMFRPSVSIGIAFAPQHASTLKELMRVADSAMYRAKEAGGNRFVVADEGSGSGKNCDGRVENSPGVASVGI